MAAQDSHTWHPRVSLNLSARGDDQPVSIGIDERRRTTTRPVGIQTGIVVANLVMTLGADPPNDVDSCRWFAVPNECVFDCRTGNHIVRCSHRLKLRGLARSQVLTDRTSFRFRGSGLAARRSFRCWKSGSAMTSLRLSEWDVADEFDTALGAVSRAAT